MKRHDVFDLVVSDTYQVTGGGQGGAARAPPKRATTVSAKAFILMPNDAEVDFHLAFLYGHATFVHEIISRPTALNTLSLATNI